MHSVCDNVLQRILLSPNNKLISKSNVKSHKNKINGVTQHFSMNWHDGKKNTAIGNHTTSKERELTGEKTICFSVITM